METVPARADAVTVPAGRPRTEPRRRGWPGLAVSVAAHVAMFGGALLYAHWSPPRVKTERPIVAKLVRLGEQRSEKLLPRLEAETAAPPPSKASPAPEPKAAPSASAKAPAPAPAKTAGPPPKTLVKPEPKIDAKRERQEAMAALDRQKRLMDALDRLGPPPTGPTAKKAEPKSGRRDGDARGNAESAEEGDRYLGLLDRALHETYVLPTTIGERERRTLQCTVFLRISRDGRVVEARVEQPSANPAFDRAIEGGLKKLRLPPPPKEFLSRYPDGLEVLFKP